MKDTDRTRTKSQKDDCEIARGARMILGFPKDLDKSRQQN